MKIKKMKRFGIMVLAIMWVVVSLTGCFTYTPTTTTTKRSYSANTTTTTATKTRFVVGETYTNSSVSIKFSKGEVWNGYDYFSAPDDGNIVIRVYFIITNLGSSDLGIGSWDFTCYADGSSASGYYYGTDKTMPFYENISSGRKLEGWIYYEVPNDTKEVEIEYERSFSNDKKVIFVIDLD